MTPTLKVVCKMVSGQTYDIELEDQSMMVSDFKTLLKVKLCVEA